MDEHISGNRLVGSDKSKMNAGELHDRVIMTTAFSAICFLPEIDRKNKLIIVSALNP